MQKPGLFGMNGFMVFLLLFVSLGARAQQAEYMILIDAENKQAFSVTLGEQLYPSSVHGHLVLSHLKDSTYRLYLRFPKKNIAEQVFQLNIRGKDLGFQLQGADSAWILYNWQTREKIRPSGGHDSSRILDQGVRRENGFSRLMAAVVNDSSVLYNTYTGNFDRLSVKQEAGSVKQEAGGVKAQAGGVATISGTTKDTIHYSNSGVKPVQQPAAPPVLPAASASVPAATNNDSVQAARKLAKENLLAARKASKDSLAAVRKAYKDSIALVKIAVYRADSLAKIARRAEKDSIQLARKSEMADKSTSANHPAPGQNASSGQSPAPVIPAVVSAESLKTESLPAEGPHPPTTIKKLREVSLKVSRKMVFLETAPDGQRDTVTLFVYFESGTETTQKAVAQVVVPAQVQKPAAKTDTSVMNHGKQPVKTAESGCGMVATDADVEFLRSAILKANTEQDKISAASTAFGMRCFSVSQLRSLAGLLVSDKAKYRLMEAARLHIADRDHFRELADMYTDKNFQRKFLVLADKPT